MTQHFSIIIATYGDLKWSERAHEVAVPSAMGQGAEVLTLHGDTLASARNRGAAMAIGRWLVFLDADDELEPGYIEALANATGTLRAPAVRYVWDNGYVEEPQTFGHRDMLTMNQCVIGTAIPTDIFNVLGGFREERAWEDWSLFRRAYLAGANITHNPKAVYRAHVSPFGRNNSVYDPHGLTEQIRRSHEEWIVEKNRKGGLDR